MDFLEQANHDLANARNTPATLRSVTQRYGIVLDDPATSEPDEEHTDD